MIVDADRISIRHRRTSVERLEREGFRHVIDVTSSGPDPWHRFSPFFPHGGIPIPGWPGRTAASVEGIWQGLKRFQFEDAVNTASLDNVSMRNIKRTSRARGRAGVERGRVLGHQWGSDGALLLGYVDARRRIYLPSYRWVLANCLGNEIALLRTMAADGCVALLDYTSNGDITEVSRPLSHAALLRAFIVGSWPDSEP